MTVNVLQKNPDLARTHVLLAELRRIKHKLPKAAGAAVAPGAVSMAYTAVVGGGLAENVAKGYEYLAISGGALLLRSVILTPYRRRRARFIMRSSTAAQEEQKLMELRRSEEA